jgi:hypothetical protein
MDTMPLRLQMMKVQQMLIGCRRSGRWLPFVSAYFSAVRRIHGRCAEVERNMEEGGIHPKLKGEVPDQEA